MHKNIYKYIFMHKYEYLQSQILHKNITQISFKKD